MKTNVFFRCEQFFRTFESVATLIIQRGRECTEQYTYLPTWSRLITYSLVVLWYSRPLLFLVLELCYQVITIITFD